MPDALREAGAVVHVMADVYGERIGQGLADKEWLRDAGEREWVVLMKDAKIRYRPAELQVVFDFDLRAFCLTNANLRGTEMAKRLVEHLPQIVRVASERLGLSSAAFTPTASDHSGLSSGAAVHTAAN